MKRRPPRSTHTDTLFPYTTLFRSEVIKEELILFVSLNTNKNTEPVRALGKMLLQNLQLVVGKRYESEQERQHRRRPLLSVVLRSEEHTSELQSLMRISYAVFCLKKKKNQHRTKYKNKSIQHP